MIDFLLLQENVPFATSLAVVALTLVLEIVLILAGLSASHALDGILPDLDGPDHVLSWLGIGKVPAYVVLVTFATAFGLIGYVGQGLLAWIGIGTLSPLPASLAALVLTLPVTGRVSRFIARVLPSDESYVGDRTKLIGAIGMLSQGNARADLPAECRVPDGHGGYLYVQAVPVHPNDIIAQGTKVIVIKREQDIFHVAPFAD